MDAKECQTELILQYHSIYNIIERFLCRFLLNKHVGGMEWYTCNFIFIFGY